MARRFIDWRQIGTIEAGMRHFLRRIGLAAAVLSTSLAAAQPQPQSQAQPQPQTQGGLVEVPVRSAAQPVAGTAAPVRPAMWLVRDADTTIYLFGTIHALPPGIDWFGGNVASAFDGSQELVTEIVETDPAQMQNAVLGKAVLPPDKSLRTMLTPPQRAAYEQALTTYGLPAASFDRLKPWYVAVFLSALPVLRDGYATEHGVEKLLETRAKAKARPHTGLETAEYQLGLFDSLPMAVQLRYLNEVVAELPTATNELGAMVEAWKRGDADTLARLMNEEESAPELMELLLVNRNKAWAEWIDKRLDAPGTVFMAVGAGHLAGNGSVQQQLAAKGIAAARVQ